MKLRKLIGVLLPLALSPFAWGQGFSASYNFTTYGFVAPMTKGPSISFANTGISSFSLSWAPASSVLTCSVQVDSSVDGVTWGNGDLIASQNCATVGSAPAAVFTNNFVRVDVTALTGNGGVNVALAGWGGKSTGGGSGTPGGISGNVQVNNAGSFGAITGTAFSNNSNLATGSIQSLSITPTAPTGAGSLTNAQHAVGINIDDQVSSVGSGTDSAMYNVCNNHATGGAFGHELCIVSRANNNSVGASSVSLVSPYYGDYSQASSDTVNEADIFTNGGISVSAGTLTLAVGANIGSGPAISGTGHVTAWNGILGQAPVASVTNLTTAITADFGNCNPNAGSGWYVNLVVCGAEADFNAPISIKGHPAAASAQPVTNAAPYGITMSEEVDADVSGGGGAINIDAFGLNGSGTISLISGVNSLAEQENVATVTETSAFRAGYRVTSGGTITNAYGLHVISPQGTSTVTHGYGAYVENLNTAVTNTNAPIGFSTQDGVELRAVTVASLPAAASSAGQMRSVSDSTAVASEGQTCVGGSSNKALAFSNGTVWKCF